MSTQGSQTCVGADCRTPPSPSSGQISTNCCSKSEADPPPACTTLRVAFASLPGALLRRARGVAPMVLLQSGMPVIARYSTMCLRQNGTVWGWWPERPTCKSVVKAGARPIGKAFVHSVSRSLCGSWCSYRYTVKRAYAHDADLHTNARMHTRTHTRADGQVS